MKSWDKCDNRTVEWEPDSMVYEWRGKSQNTEEEITIIMGNQTW